MAQEQMIVAVGNLTNDPELRFTPSGAAVANFTIAATERQFNRDTNEWADANTNYWDCSVWRDTAENVAESLTKGMPVVAYGIVRTQSWEDKNGGGKRSKMVLEVQNIGPDLRRTVAQVAKGNRGNAQQVGGAGYGQQGGQQGGQQRAPQGAGGGWGGPQAQQADPWAQQAAGGWGAPSNGEPPF